MGDQLAGFGGGAAGSDVARKTASVGRHVVGGEHEQTGGRRQSPLAWRAAPRIAGAVLRPIGRESRDGGGIHTDLAALLSDD